MPISKVKVSGPKVPRAKKRIPASPALEIRAYLDALPPGTRRHLLALREAVRAAVPGVEDAFSYRIPGYRVAGRIFIWYAAFTEHVSLYPMTAAIRAAHADALAGYKTATGTVQFPLTRPIPVALVKKLAQARLAEMRAAASTKTPAKKSAAKKTAAARAQRAGRRPVRRSTSTTS